MNLKIIKPVLLALIFFLGGYQFAILTVSRDSDITAQSRPENQQGSIDKVSERSSFESTDANAHAIKSNTSVPNTNDRVASPASPDHNDFSDRLIHNDVNAMLANLDGLREEGAANEIIATQFDVLKQFLIENPENVRELASELDRQSVNSESFDDLLSILGTLPSELTDPTFLSMAEQYQYASTYDGSSQKRFLTALSNISTPAESEALVRSLVDIVLFEETETTDRLTALRLVNPGQLQESEKNSVAKELNQLINNANEQDSVRLLPHLIRFSDKNRRTEIASNFLSISHVESTRHEILNSISSGTIPANDDVKAMLFKMAETPEDALSQAAAETLKHAFELNHEEYSRLRS